MSANKKKWVLYIVVLALVLGIGTAGFMYRASARVEAEVRANLAGLPDMSEYSIDKVQYNPFTRILTLKNLHVVFVDANTTTDITFGEIVSELPSDQNRARGLLLEDMHVAHCLLSHTTTEPPTQLHYRAESTRLVKPELNPDLSAYLAKSNDTQMYAFKAESLHFAGLSMSYSSHILPHMRMTLDSVDADNLNLSHIGAATFKNWELDVQDKGKVSLGALEISALNLPHINDILQTGALFGQFSSPPSVDDTRALLDTLGIILPRDRTTLGKLVLQDVKESFSGGNAYLQRLTVDNCWYGRQVDLTLEGLSIPTNVLPTAVIGMLGYEHLHMSGELTLRNLAGNMTRLSSSLDIQDAGKAQVFLNVKGKLPSPMVPFKDIHTLLLESLTLCYFDKGLASRGLRLAQSTMNMGPDMVAGAIRANAADSLGNDPQALEQLMNFVEKPGELTILINPASPKPIGQIVEELNPADVRVTSVPGPKTLQELAKP